MIRCEHGVYDPHGDARYCTCCHPIAISGSRLEKIQTSVGQIVLSPAPQTFGDKGWNGTLAKHDLSEIAEDGLLEDERHHIAEDGGLISIEDFTEEEPRVIEDEDVTQREVSTASNQDEMGQLRRKLDGSDTFMSGYQVNKIRGRCRLVPEWTRSDFEVRQVLLKAFPKATTNPKQRARAARWNFIIYRYFRMQESRGQIAADLETTDREIRRTIERILHTFRGDSANGRPRRKMGRPKKLSD